MRTWSAVLAGICIAALADVPCAATAVTDAPGGPRAAVAAQATGTIAGQVLDRDTKAPLAGVTVSARETGLSTISDAQGRFTLPGVPVGSHSLRFARLGYEPLTEADVIVRPSRITTVLAELRAAALAVEGLVVRPAQFVPPASQPTSHVAFSAEEVRRAPGSAGDISRVILGLPSLAKVNDQSNGLIVRGGSPSENAFYVDGIEVPNINHFPTQGASGGPIGLLNVDFIREVGFSAGGFSALYGDRLSSVMEIRFREGNRRKLDGQLDLNFAGFGGGADGPLAGGHGAWLVSARRSYLDLLVEAVEVGTSIAPRYGDVQGKLVYDASPAHQLTLLGLWGDSHSRSTRAVAEENAMTVYGEQDYASGTLGLSWRALWKRHGFSATALSYSRNAYDEDYAETSTGLALLRNRSRESALRLRNVNHLKLGGGTSLDAGAEASYLFADFDSRYAEHTDALSHPAAALHLDERPRAAKLGAFASVTVQPLARWTLTGGLRADHFTWTGHSQLSPRLALSYALSERTSLNAAAGAYHQALPLLLLAQDEANTELAAPRAVHYVVGVTHLFGEDTRLTLEGYEKHYRRFPVDPRQPQLFVLDELTYGHGFFGSHARLVDAGRAVSRGVEAMLQRKLAQGVYGLASAAWFRTRYRGADGVWRDRAFDNRVILSAEGGYKPNRRWEASVRWIYAGGPPYTPLDVEASRRLGRSVLDAERIHQARYPAYHSLNLRTDRRFHFRRSNLVAYLSLWNAYDRKNVATYYWNATDSRVAPIYQWGRLPLFGLEYEF